MSPSLARCTWSNAPWEIMESEHIDFPATDLGGGPDEGLRRKCSRILLPPGRLACSPQPGAHLAGAAGPCPLTWRAHAWAPRWHRRAVPSSQAWFRSGARPLTQAASAGRAGVASCLRVPGSSGKERATDMGILAPGSPQLKPGTKSHGSLWLGDRGTVRASPAGLQGDLEETGGKPVPVVFASVSLPLEASVSR